MHPIYLFSISSHPDAVSVPSLSITFFKPDIDFSNYDAFIITSKQASKALQQYQTQSYIDVPALCVSKASAQSYEALGGKVLDIGGGYGDNLREKIKNYPKSMRWLYLRAKLVASDFVKQCKKEGYKIVETIMYESSCSQDILNVKVSEDAVLIFTSPSSLECFLQTHTLSKRSKVIVIGKTTAETVPEGIEYHISSQTTVESCIELAKKLSNGCL